MIHDVIYAMSRHVTLQNEMGEARMDVIDSEIAYLGFHDSESYGLTWKVRLL